MPPNGWMKLHPGEAVIMQGAVPTIGSLLKSPDFQFMEEVKIGEKALRSLDLITVEALLSPNSRYTGRTMQQTNFGRDYGFSVLGFRGTGRPFRKDPPLRDWSMATPCSCSAITRISNDSSAIQI